MWIENPAGSDLLAEPVIERWACDFGLVHRVLSYCQYGGTVCKNTAFVMTMGAALHFCNKQCPRDHRCDLYMQPYQGVCQQAHHVRSVQDIVGESVAARKGAPAYKKTAAFERSRVPPNLTMGLVRAAIYTLAARNELNVAQPNPLRRGSKRKEGCR